MTYLNSNETTTMVASHTIIPFQGAEGKYFIFFGTIPQEIIINDPTAVASTMMAHISAAAPVEEEDEEEVYFIITQKSTDNKIMDSPPGPQKRRRRPTKKVISPKTASTLKVSQKGTREYLKNAWWLGQISLYPTLSSL
jgi:hypothetical protein